MSSKRAQKNSRRQARKDKKKTALPTQMSNSMKNIISIMRENERYFTKMLPEVLEIDKEIAASPEINLLTEEELNVFKAEREQRSAALGELIAAFDKQKAKFEEAKGITRSADREYAMDNIVSTLEDLMIRTTQDFLEKAAKQEDTINLLKSRKDKIQNDQPPVNL